MGSLWMLAAGASFALMGVVVKQGATAFSSHEMVFWRSAVGLAMLYAFLRLPSRGGVPKGVATAHLGLQLRRGLVGFVALTAFFYSLAKLPMSVAITLNYTSPLFLVLLMPWSLQERPRPAQYASVVLGFIGVALLLRPWQAGSDVHAGLVGLFSGFMAAIAYVHVRQLGKLGEPEWRTVFWFSVVGMVGAGVTSSLTGWHLPGENQIGLESEITDRRLGRYRHHRGGRGLGGSIQPAGAFMIAIKSQERLISVSVIGEFTLSDYKEFEEHILYALKSGGVSLLLDLRDMISYTLDVAWEELRFAREHRYDFRKIAVVTGDEWMVWIAWLNRAFVDGEVQVFDDPGIALDWLSVEEP
jgi:uncharacterized membrane protein